MLFFHQKNWCHSHQHLMLFKQSLFWCFNSHSFMISLKDYGLWAIKNLIKKYWTTNFLSLNNHLCQWKDVNKFTNYKLTKSGYTINWSMTKRKENARHYMQETHIREINWFNSLYNKNVLTKVRKYFLNLLDMHFPSFYKFPEA